MTTITTTPSNNPRKKPSLRHRMWKHRTEYLLISPFFIIFGIFHGYPLLWSLWLSLHRWGGIGPMRWFGLGNYERLLSNKRVLASMTNTLQFVVILLPLMVATALILATVLNSKTVIGRNILRSLYFLPYITSAVIVAIIFQLLLNTNFGWVNGILETIGLTRIGWLTEPWPAKAAIIIMVIWSVTGYNVLIMLGGLQGIPDALYDAASVDGASTTQKFRYITIPSMRGTILFITLTSTILLLNLFIQPWLLFQSTSGRGPEQATSTLNTIQYATAFQSARYGEAAALGFIIAILIFIIAIVQLRIAQRADA